MTRWRVGVCLLAGEVLASVGCGGNEARRPLPYGAGQATGHGNADAGAVGGRTTRRDAGGGAGGDGQPATVFQPALCEPDSWCWMNPLPQGRALMAVWGTSPLDIWASTEVPGVFLHRGADGVWRHVAGGANTVALSIWGTGPTSAWAVGRVADGTSGAGAILRWDGVRWSEVHRSEAALTDIDGAAPDDIWAVGPGAVLHFDGNAWTRAEDVIALLDPDAIPFPHRVAVSAPDDVWILNGFELHRWDGVRWSTQPGGQVVNDIWAAAPDDAFRTMARLTDVVVQRWDGALWQASLPANRMPPSSPFLSEADMMHVSGSAADDVWAADTQSNAYHFDGSDWTVTATGEPVDINDLWADAPGVAMMVGAAGEIRELSGGAWRRVTRGPTTSAWAIDGSGPDNVWIGGDARMGLSGFAPSLMHWDGVLVRDVALPSGLPADAARITTVWAADDDTLWVGGGAGLLARRDGSSWTALTVTNRQILSIWGARPDDAWMVTSLGPVFHWDGRDWSPVAVPVDFPEDVHGSAPDDVWITGNQTQPWASTAAHWNGREWTRSPPGGGGKVWVNAPNDVWSHHEPFGSFTQALDHFDGTSWQRVREFAPEELVFDIWSPGAGEVYVVGRDIHHLEGGVWSRIDTPFMKNIWGSSRNDIWTAGEDGAALRRLTAAP